MIIKTLTFISLLLIFNISNAQNQKTRFTISASNLSEDASLLSSNNDEVLFLVYKDVDGDLGKPVIVEYFVFDSLNTKASFDINLDQTSSYKYFLLEMDSDRDYIQIDPILRVHHQAIKECHEKHDYLAVEKYLSDEDILGLGEFKIPDEIDIKGIYKIDKYSYQINIALKNKKLD
ncbi:hypothetical protein [Aureibacter tunicatorum]|uniref:Uncharacterized protein n=1 Tax=Aureibacter tunicatorum TaxID=866807 RepID=A0AAE3XL75_9BACT|nr:hypothetical protein [Aureibacter tunicatorum]MDR6238907.1 hypothetical protein [Aureibacter tunicatorum]BDD05166.1 hypothetical protein AUTU_26490 [Aureibacter tunicatorum]